MQILKLGLLVGLTEREQAEGPHGLNVAGKAVKKQFLNCYLNDVAQESHVPCTMTEGQWRRLQTKGKISQKEGLKIPVEGTSLVV